jgi:hypothetical protein
VKFRVVTEFVFRLHKQRRTVFCGMMIYMASSLDALLQVTLEWMKTRDANKEAMVQVMTRSEDGYVGLVYAYCWVAFTHLFEGSRALLFSHFITETKLRDGERSGHSLIWVCWVSINNVYALSLLSTGPLIDECKERPYEEANTLFVSIPKIPELARLYL